MSANHGLLPSETTQRARGQLACILKWPAAHPALLAFTSLSRLLDEFGSRIESSPPSDLDFFVRQCITPALVEALRKFVPDARRRTEAVEQWALWATVAFARTAVRPNIPIVVVDPRQTRTAVAEPRYRIDERLGGGAFGEVFAGWQFALNRQVALKRPNEAYLVRFGGEQFRREGVLVARVDHPAVCRVFDVWDGPDGLPYLVMERLGRTLAQALRARHTSFTQPEVARLGRSLARGLQAIATAGILHRDIKLANILERTPDEWVITDFGVSRNRATVCGVAGTPNYIAPELLGGDCRPCEKSDVYSLSVVLFRLLTLSFPRPGNDTSNHQAIVSAGCTPAFATVLVRGLAEKPGDRPTAAGLANQLAAHC